MSREILDRQDGHDAQIAKAGMESDFGQCRMDV